MSHLRDVQQAHLKKISASLPLQRSWHVLDVGIGGDKIRPSDNYVHFPSDHFSTLDIDPYWAPTHVGDICNPPFRTSTFDLVLCCQTLEHVWDVRRAVWECHRILKPGGWLLVDVPFVFEYHESPEDYWRISHTALTRLCNEAGLHGTAELIDGILSSILCQKPQS